jgi:gamma-glutamyltranspeptidase/glutathione hydrolase
MWALHEKLGSMPWKELLQPAVELAYHGVVLTKREADILNSNQEDFKKANTYIPWVIRDEGWQEGDSVVQRELAATLAFIRDRGRDGFYKGIVADQIVKEMERGGGWISQEDLDQYDAIWRKPVKAQYRDYEIIGMPPPSSGGIALIQLLHGAQQWDLQKFEPYSAEHIHLMAEIEKRVYADRARYLGDADFVEIPLETLLSQKYLNNRFASIKPSSVTKSSDISAGEAFMEIHESEETTHFSIVDENGNALAITTTLNGNMGSDVMVKGAGFFLNNEMDDFSAKPGTPNMFGLIGSKANEIQPGKRMLSSMTPTIITQNDTLKMVLGTPGGATIITSVFQIIHYVLEQGLGLQEAINHPRVHHQWLPDRIYFERGHLPPSLKRKLERMGHHTYERGPIGRIDAILIHEDGSIEGASDPTRSDGTAKGY